MKESETKLQVFPYVFLNAGPLMRENVAWKIISEDIVHCTIWVMNTFPL